MVTHCGAAAPGEYNALDTHWIWQEGMERLTTRAAADRRRRDRASPTRPGLGVELDMDRLLAAHELYQEKALGARDDAAGDAVPVPAGRSTTSAPCLVR